MIPTQLDRTQRILLVVIFALLFAIGAFFLLMRELEKKSEPLPQMSSTVSATGRDALPRGVVVIGDRQIPVDLALDEASQEHGLSDRPSLPEGEGMLFIFDTPQRQMFWMNGMKFPLDMVFINGTRVVDVSSNVHAPGPGEFPAVVSSLAEADKVFEINAGKAKEWGIGVGTEVMVERSL